MGRTSIVLILNSVGAREGQDVVEEDYLLLFIVNPL